jgi:hypothetical protein
MYYQAKYDVRGDFRKKETISAFISNSVVDFFIEIMGTKPNQYFSFCNVIKLAYTKFDKV